MKKLLRRIKAWVSRQVMEDHFVVVGTFDYDDLWGRPAMIIRMVCTKTGREFLDEPQTGGLVIKRICPVCNEMVDLEPKRRPQ